MAEATSDGTTDTTGEPHTRATVGWRCENWMTSTEPRRVSP